MYTQKTIASSMHTRSIRQWGMVFLAVILLLNIVVAPQIALAQASVDDTSEDAIRAELSTVLTLEEVDQVFNLARDAAHQLRKDPARRNQVFQAAEQLLYIVDSSRRDPLQDIQNVLRDYPELKPIVQFVQDRYLTDSGAVEASWPDCQNHPENHPNWCKFVKVFKKVIAGFLKAAIIACLILCL